MTWLSRKEFDEVLDNAERGLPRLRYLPLGPGAVKTIHHQKMRSADVCLLGC